MRYTMLLNADYTPIQIITWWRAMNMLFAENDSAILMEPYMKDGEVLYARSPSAQFPMPAIVVLKRYVKAHKQTVRLSNRNIHLRDGHMCQYTGRKLSKSELSIDHVVPLSRGGKSTWENMVTCCKEINRMKGCKTMEQAGLNLRSVPRKPDWYRFLVKRIVASGNPIWISYLTALRDPEVMKL